MQHVRLTSCIGLIRGELPSHCNWATLEFTWKQTETTSSRNSWVQLLFSAPVNQSKQTKHWICEGALRVCLISVFVLPRFLSLLLASYVLIPLGGINFWVTGWRTKAKEVQKSSIKILGSTLTDEQTGSGNSRNSNLCFVLCRLVEIIFWCCLFKNSKVFTV